MAFPEEISSRIGDYDADSLVNFIEQPACTYSFDSRNHISHNTAFKILFKGMHPSDVIGLMPSNIKEALSEGQITNKKSYRNIIVGDKRFTKIEILPFYRDYIFKFHVSKSFSTDYKQIFQIIFDKSPLGILLVDKNLKFIAANKAITDMIGYTLEELKQMTFMDITHPDDIERNLPLTRKLYSEEIDSFTIQKRYVKKDGGVIWINLVTALTKDLNGEFLGGMGIVEDITDRLSMEDQRTELLHSLREKNREIIDSLAYARNIQNVLLPRKEEFERYFPNHFVYYHPKDIVGGDFYWIRTHQDHVYFAVADCTGHGVPGAFISLIGNYRLNMIFEKYAGSEPGFLLDKLNNIISYSFRSPMSSISHHGMDIAMCRYNMKTGELNYSGANNSLILIREGIEEELSPFFKDSSTYRFANKDLLEIKANKNSIGSYTGRDIFTSHSIQTKKGDRIYLFTDGYPDQFGGARSKKLKMSNFKDFLHKQFDLKFRKQEEHMHKFRMDWQGDLQQVDDICVIGIEF